MIKAALTILSWVVLVHAHVVESATIPEVWSAPPLESEEMIPRFWTAPVISGSRVFIGLTSFQPSPDFYMPHSSRVAAYEKESGREIWKTTADRPWDLAAGGKDELYLLSATEFLILSATKGWRLWRYPLPFDSRDPSIGNIVVGTTGLVYVPGGTAQVLCIDAPRRTVQFQREFSSPLSWMAFGPTNNLFVLLSDKILSLESTTGEVVWERQIFTVYPRTQPLVSNHGQLIVFSKSTNSVTGVQMIAWIRNPGGSFGPTTLLYLNSV